jgi:Amt family ammonium transporter
MDASMWLVIFGMGTLLMRAASAMHASGMVRSKNSSGAVVRCVADLALGTLAFWFIGYAIFDAVPFHWGSTHRMLLGLVNWPEIAFTPPSIDLVVGQSGTFFFLLCAILIAGSIVVGVAAERAKFWPMCCASILIAGLVTPIAGAWITSGWLKGHDFTDLAWAGPIHLVGAACAASLAILAGPRMGKYNRDGSSNAIPGHNLPLVSIGVVLSVVGWIPYCLGFWVLHQGRGESAGQVAANVLLAGAAGAAVAMFMSQFRYSKPDIHLTYIGLLGGLVAITAAPNLGSTWMAVVIGAVAGLIVPTATLIIDLIWRIDDPTGGIAVHGVGAIWGLLAAGIFGPAASFKERVLHFGVQAMGAVAIILLATILASAVFWLLKQTVRLRSKEADEFDGLDLAEHDINAYPDFQQTMIKSYHLREA